MSQELCLCNLIRVSLEELAVVYRKCSVQEIGPFNKLLAQIDSFPAIEENAENSR